MSNDLRPKTMESRMNMIEAKDERREEHYQQLKKDLISLRDGQREIIQLLGGSALNGNKGFVKLMEIVENKVDEMQDKINLHESSINQAVWWGRLIALPIIGLLIKEIFGK